MRSAGLIALLVGASLAAGCESYAEHASCTNGTVFDDDGNCVLPAAPDGGVAFETCAELCALIPDWSSTEVECLQTNLMRTGPLPTECAVLDTTALCDACVVAAGADDLACALSSSCL